MSVVTAGLPTVGRTTGGATGGFLAGHATKNSSSVRAVRTSRTILRIAYDRAVRGLVLTTIVAIAACAPSGLTIEVVGLEEGTVVELYAGQYCNDCPRGVHPPGLLPTPIFEAYVTFEREAQPQTVPPGTDVIGFRVATEHDTWLGIILIVARNPDGSVRGTFVKHHVAIDKETSERWQVTEFVPTGELTDFNTVGAFPDGTRRMKYWNRRPANAPGCILYEEWNARTTSTNQTVVEVKRELIVPEFDTDCDGEMENECAPWEYQAPVGPPNIETADCVSKNTLDGVCRIQGPPCSETSVLPPSDCVPLPEDYCLPSQLCNCTPTIDPACFERVFAESLMPGGVPMSHLDCTIQIDAEGRRCDSVIADARGKYQLGTTQCTDIRFADLAIPFGPFVTEALLPSSQVTLQLRNFAQPCQVELDFQGSTMPGVRLGLIELALDNQSHLVLPARLEFVSNGCMIRSTCDFHDQSALEGITKCVAALPTTCNASEQCFNGGTYCGDICCEPGETCTPTGCMCGIHDACEPGDRCIQTIFNSDNCGTQCCGSTPCAVPIQP